MLTEVQIEAAARKLCEAVEYANKMTVLEWMGAKGQRAANFCPPPSPCECGHSFGDHRQFNDDRGCRSCNCSGYFEAKR